MFLHKFCEEKYVLPNSPTIRVGTLYGYRKAEEKIRDDGEGSFEYVVNISRPKRVTSFEFSLLTGGAINIYPNFGFRIHGLSRFICDELIMGPTDNGLQEILYYRGRVRMDVPNALVFSMSLGEVGMKSPFAGSNYDGRWCLPKKLSSNVGWAISRSLADNLNTKDFHGLQGKPIYVGEPPKFIFSHGEVKYSDRVISISEADRLDEDFFLDLYQKIPFLKPVSYQGEREYRFVFKCELGGVVYPPKSDGIVIDSSGLKKLL